MTEQPFFRSLTGEISNFISPEEERAAAAGARREAAREQMAFDRALGRPRLPKLELPQVKTPELRVADLGDAIFKRGVAVDAEKLVARGKELFAELLVVDRKAPRGVVGAGMDLTHFESVQRALHAFESPVVPRRTAREQTTGTGKEREKIRAIAGFEDLWKFTSERQETIDAIYAFRDAFESLILGQSILEKLSPDGRLRSRFLCGGRGAKVDLFHDWLGVLEGSFTSVKLVDPLFALMAWMSNEKSPTPSLDDLAGDFFNARSPTSQQVRLAESVLDAYLLGYRDDWQLWQYVGRRTRTATDQGRLSSWRKALAAHFPRITGWHDEVRAFFFKDVGYAWDSHREFDAAEHRAFIDRIIQERLDALSAQLALAVETAFPASVIARFQGSVLCEGKPPEKRAELSGRLAAAFPHSTFQLEFEEVRP
jgi:hypothetical protein